ncbi:MAG: SAM-dependent methyltransferase [Bacteroidales bacterium]|nr:SAM-dependent methyltransferase [Bacteroidales bacterium]
MQTLFLIPSPLGDSPIDHILPGIIQKVINSVDFYIVENERTARRFLLKAGLKKPVDEITFFVLDKYAKPDDVEEFLLSVSGSDIGIISEAGVPCIADPGSDIVRTAHEKGIRVIPLTGPSSILMGMMASGLNGQNFAFVGYLPIRHHERITRIRQLEKRSLQEKQSQIFIETPYRNNQLLKDILETCHPETMLCIGADITLDTEKIETRSIREWKTKRPELHKRPAIFIIQRF